MLVSNYQRVSHSLSPHIRKSLLSFFQDYESSAIAPGKNDCFTKCKIKKQKQYLVDTLKNLHKKYIYTSTFNVLYSTFCRAKPFWVVKPTISAKDTCMCKKHANFQYLITKLHILKVVSCKQASTLISTVVCDVMSKEWMYRNCNKCKDIINALLL